MPAAIGDKPGRKYARERTADVKHLRLDVTPDFAARTIRGTADITFAALTVPLSEWELDAVGLHVESITLAGTTLLHTDQTEEKIRLTFSPLAPEAQARISITYSAQPANGLFFRTPAQGYPAGDTQVWSQGEAELHRFWFPCFDAPNDRLTTEVICHVPEGMQVVSNGQLLNLSRDADGLLRWHWRQDIPHAQYLLALAAGHFHRMEARAGSTALRLFVPPSEREQAANAFADSVRVIFFYEKETGTPFPWAKYDQVYCHDFVAGGMENTSATFMAASELFTTDTEQLNSLRDLDAHEAAHQWFGDLVTCRDWAHLWLNEGFASYYTLLYADEAAGRDEFLQGLWRAANRVWEAHDERPIVWRDYRDPMEQFDSRAYPKGAWLLHMIRSQIGPETFRRVIKTYLQRHRGTVVTTDDFQDVLEDITGRSFDQFFDQWAWHGGFPELKVDTSWDEKAQLVKISVRQTQKVTDKVPLFHFPLPVRLRWMGVAVDGKPGALETRDVTLDVTQATEDFYLSLPQAPVQVQVDPEFTVLALLEFTPPPAQLTAALDPQSGNLVGRLRLTRGLGDHADTATVGRLEKLAQADPHWGVRVEAVKALKKIATPEARQSLIRSTSQPDARVRKEVATALAAFFHSEAHLTLARMAERERNPEVLAELVGTFAARAGQPGVSELLRQHLASQTYMNPVALAAIQALRDQDDSAAVPDVLKRLRQDPQAFPTRGFATALDHLASLASRETAPQREDVRFFLSQFLSHAKPELRAAAATALGTLGDAKSLPHPPASRRRAAAVYRSGALRGRTRDQKDRKPPHRPHVHPECDRATSGAPEAPRNAE
jgi:aminopeptidase N